METKEIMKENVLRMKNPMNGLFDNIESMIAEMGTEEYSDALEYLYKSKKMFNYAIDNLIRIFYGRVAKKEEVKGKTKDETICDDIVHFLDYMNDEHYISEEKRDRWTDWLESHVK